MFDKIYFEYPALLHLLWILPLQAILLAVYWRWRTRTLRLMGSRALEERLLLGFSIWRFRIKNLLYAASLALVAVAFAGPVKLVKEPGKTQNGADVLIALDVSTSMLATDVKPSRLGAASDFIRKLVSRLDEDRIGLLFFAGEAYPQMPLSLDHEALLMFVRNANPDFITNQGTDIGAAIELGRRMLEQENKAGKALILISDGENHEEKVQQRVREAREAGISVFAVGIGSAAGATIPLGGGVLQRDINGQPVKTRANEVLMRSIAEAGDGQYLNLRDEGQALDVIKKAVDGLQKTAITSNASTQKVYYFPWLLLAAFIFLVIEQVMPWKKAALTTGVFLLACFFHNLSAQTTHFSMRAGEKAYDEGNYTKAQQAFEKTGTATGAYNAGNAAMRDEQYETAAKYYKNAAVTATSPSLKADAWYNLGNACLLQNKFQEAIKAYESSLRLSPGRSDAQKNLQIAKRQLQPPPPVPPPPPPPPPKPRPQRYYLDRATTSRKPDIPPASLPAEAARQMLQKAVLAQEQENVRTYRALSPSVQPNRLKKNW